MFVNMRDGKTLAKGTNLFACASEAAFTAFRCRKLLCFLKGNGKEGHDDELSDAFAGRYCAGNGGIVVECDDVFASVVGIGNANAVGGTEAFLCGETASCEDGAEVSFGNGDGKTCADLDGFACSDRDCFVKTSVEIIAGCVSGSSGGKLRVIF